jgi:hypothetical protein
MFISADDTADGPTAAHRSTRRGSPTDVRGSIQGTRIATDVHILETVRYRFLATPRAGDLPAFFARADVVPRFPELRAEVLDVRVDERVELLAAVRPVLVLRFDAVFRAAPVRLDVDRDDDFAVRPAPLALVDDAPRPLAVFRPRFDPPPPPRRLGFALPRETSLMNRLLPSWIMAARRRASNVSNH